MLKQPKTPPFKNLVLNAQKNISIYFIVSIFLNIVWNFMSTHLSLDAETIRHIGTITSLIYLSITAILVSLFFRHHTSAIHHSENLLHKNNIQLIQTNNELLAIDEKLRHKLTESLEQQKIIKDQNEYVLALLAAMPDLIFHFDKNGLFIDYNATNNNNVLANSINPLIGKSVYDLLPLALAEDTKQMIAKVLETNELQIMEYNLPVDDHDRYWEARLVKVNENQVLAVVRDTTQRSQLLKELHYVSLHDHLTGLYNRAYFEQQMQHLNGTEHLPITLLICDLDGLKTINDTLGHQFGDQLLKAAATTLSGAFRKHDIIARIGGDEFAILLPNTPVHEAEKAYQRIRKAEMAYNKENPSLILGISIGFAVSDEQLADTKNLFVEADINMYKQKNRRKL
ncbi:GGDEF domain-containing protein [Pelosinus sp. sgz500959]|uniref:GGDEF domain-containing protein n=1 Tax=Pelosinus sp. sgz500959 TaxID=3242472 RepID=UPI003671ECDA